MPSEDYKCALCDCASSKKSRKHSGGSLSSDAVISLVACNSFSEMMAASQTNEISGGNNRVQYKFDKQQKQQTKHTKHTKQTKQTKRVNVAGGSSCDDANASSSLYDSYVIGPASVPSSLPAVNPDSVAGMQNITASVLRALNDTPVQLVDVHDTATYPSYFIPNNIQVSSQIGGHGDFVGCMCE